MAGLARAAERTNLAWKGAVSGLAGGVAAVFVLWGAWMLPVLGLLFTRANPVFGALAVLFLGAVGGLAYGLVYPWWAGRAMTEDRAPARGALVAGGFILGAVMWAGGALVAIPAALGLRPFPAAPAEQLVSLAAFLVYGVVTAFWLAAIARPPGEGRRARLIQASVTLIVLSAAASLFLLRSAQATDPSALELPPGFRAEVVAKGFTFPTSLAVASDGTILVGEAGFSYGPKTAAARILAINPGTGAATEVARGFDGPLNGLALRGDDRLYVSHRGKVTVLTLAWGKGGAKGGTAGDAAGPRVTVTGRRDLVTGLPSLGDHQNDDLAFGPDGMLYLGQGTATNAGVVGSDNFVYGWADKYPDVGDVPSRDWTLVGQNYVDLNLRTADPVDKTFTGAFAPFGHMRRPGEKAAAGPLPNGAVLKINPDTGAVTVYADGLRNPYGLAFGPDGSLYATVLGYDDRGVRAVKGSPDWLVRVREGAWYGWPDYAGTVPLSDPRFASDRGDDRMPLIGDPPPVEPPLVTFGPHSSPMKLAVSPGGPFGTPGELFVPLFGDVDPVTQALPARVATRVVRVDPSTGQCATFLGNRGNQPRAGRYGPGLKRLIAVAFAPNATAMYVLDFGELETTDLAPNAIPNTGILWRIVPEPKTAGRGRP